MRAIIFINGLIDDYAWLANMVNADDHLIGADGGTRHCLAIGRTPDVVVGDLDSLDDALVAQLCAQNVELEQHRPDKNETDLELAIERALRDGADEVVLVGALGGRLDQTLANLFILGQRNWGVAMSVRGQNDGAQLLRAPGRMVLAAPIGATVSVIPLSETVTGITYRGLEYPLINHTLRFGSTRGISNVVKEKSASIRIESGLLLVIEQWGS